MSREMKQLRVRLFPTSSALHLLFAAHSPLRASALFAALSLQSLHLTRASLIRHSQCSFVSSARSPLSHIVARRWPSRCHCGCPVGSDASPSLLVSVRGFTACARPIEEPTGVKEKPLPNVDFATSGWGKTGTKSKRITNLSVAASKRGEDGKDPPIEDIDTGIRKDSC